LQWPDGKHESLDIRVFVTPRAAVAAKGSKDFLVALTPVTRAASPGGSAKLRYLVVSNEETDERVRLRVEAGPGWRLLDPEVLQQELLLEAWDKIEGEFDLVVSEEAQIGQRQLVRLFVSVVGDPGEMDARGYVSVVKRGRIKPGVTTASVTSTVGMSNLASGGVTEPRRADALTVSTKLPGGSSVSFAYDRGPQENLTNFRTEEELRTRLIGNIRHAGWDLSFGNSLSSPSNALVGPSVLGRGASVRRPTGRLVAELLVGQPNAFDGSAASGHLMRGRVGLRTRTATVALAISDFGRPAGGYTTLPSVQQQVLDHDANEELEVERRLTADSASNRVRGFGLDAEFRRSRAHRVTLRAGALSLSNAAGARVAGPAAEALYSYSAPQMTFNARWRETPPTVQGIFIPRDELSADGSRRVIGKLALVGRAYRNSLETMGSDFSSRSGGASFGLRYIWNARTLEVRGNYRESQVTRRNLRRTISVVFATPVGPLVLSGDADVGEQDNGRRVARLAFYRGDLRWIKDGSTVSFGITHSEGGGPPIQRVDLLASLKVHEIELAGGAWATRGYTSGGRPGLWTSVGLPVGGDRILTLGIDYSPLTWTSEPSLRGTVTIRQRFTLPVPFLPASWTEDQSR